MSRAFFFAHYTAWAIIWAHVLAYYALFAHRQWRENGGTWRALPVEACRLLHFTFMPMLRDCVDIVCRRPLDDSIPVYRYLKAHRMAFFIAMGAVTYMLMGASFSIYPDRSLWSPTQQALSILLVCTASAAGLGHLFTALETHPRRWRWFIAAIVAWYPLAMWGFNVLNPLQA